MVPDIIRAETLFPHMEETALDAVIDRLLDGTCASGHVLDRGAARAAILAQEHRLATTMEHGIAIPHAKTEAVDSVAAALGTTAAPLTLPGVTPTPARIFLLVLAPRGGVAAYLRFLADMGRLLKLRTVRDRLLAASTPRDMLAALAMQDGS